MKFVFVLITAILFSISSQASELEQAEAATAEAIANESAPTQVQPNTTGAAADSKSLDYTKLLGGPALSLFVGFGSGVGIQGNFLERGFIYGTVDALGGAALIYATIECNTQAQETREGRRPPGDCEIDPAVEALFGLSVISHLAQFVESTIWSFKYYYQYKTTVYILPSEEGASLTFAIEF